MRPSETYESEKVALDDGTWQHERIILRPDTSSPGHSAIVLNPEGAHELRLIAKLVEVLPGEAG